MIDEEIQQGELSLPPGLDVADTPAPVDTPPPAPEATPEPPPAPTSDPGPTPTPVQVVSVDELIDRLTQGGGEADAAPEGSVQPEETPAPEETAAPEETVVPEETAPPVLVVTGEGGGPLVVQGMDEVLERLETLEQTADHPAFTTSFEDYTVTEALLLLLLLATFAAACFKILKGGSKWLRS